MDIDMNYLAVLVAAIAAFAIGFLWHGPLFGKQWIKLSGITEKEIEKAKEEMNMVPYMVVAFVQQVVKAFVVAMFSSMLGIGDALGAVQLAFWAWLGFIATTLLDGVLWEKRTVPLYLFNIAYHLVSLVVIALIVGLWK